MRAAPVARSAVCVPRAGGRARPERYSPAATLLAVVKVPLRKRPDTRDMTPPKKIQTGIAAVAVVGLTAAGAAVAANKLQGTKSSQQTAAAGTFAAASSTTKSGTDRDHHGGPGFRHDDLANAASYLGITQAALETALQSGKTLAQVADVTSGKSAAGLIDALVAAEKTELAAAVTAGRLTQAQADQIATGLTAHVTAEVNGTRPDHGPGGPGFGHGAGGDELTA